MSNTLVRADASQASALTKTMKTFEGTQSVLNSIVKDDEETEGNNKIRMCSVGCSAMTETPPTVTFGTTAAYVQHQAESSRRPEVAAQGNEALLSALAPRPESGSKPGMRLLNHIFGVSDMSEYGAATEVIPACSGIMLPPSRYGSAESRRTNNDNNESEDDESKYDIIDGKTRSNVKDPAKMKLSDLDADENTENKNTKNGELYPEEFPYMVDASTNTDIPTNPKEDAGLRAATTGERNSGLEKYRSMEVKPGQGSSTSLRSRNLLVSRCFRTGGAGKVNPTGFSINVEKQNGENK